MLVPRQTVVEEDTRVRFGRRVLRSTFGEKIPPTEFVKTGEPRVRVERLLLDRLAYHLVSDLADRNLPSVAGTLAQSC